MGILDEVAGVLSDGAQKYSDHSWKEVPNGENRYLAASLRHISAHMQGEIRDSETGRPHLAHAICSLIFALWHNGA